MSWKDALNDFKVSEGLAKPAASSSASSSSSSSWRDAPAASASLGYTSAVESTDLREARRLREREERERIEFERSEAEKVELERQASVDIRRRGQEDADRTVQFKREEEEFQKRSEYYSDSINKDIARALDANEFDKMVVHNTHELEQQTSLLHMQEATEADELRRRQLKERQRIIDCQSTNTLGLLSAANTGANSGPAQAVAPINISAGESAHAWPRADTSSTNSGAPAVVAAPLPGTVATAASASSQLPPSYNEATTNTKVGRRSSVNNSTRALVDEFGDAPPVYDSAELFAQQKTIEDTSTFLNPAATGDKPRCGSCFDEISTNAAKGFTGKAIVKGSKTYHAECYFARHAEKCDHCVIPLVANEARGLSGIWGIHKGEKYHVECFQREAGPRCVHCFDVVFANPSKNISGRWLCRPSDRALMHQECYLKLLKLVAEANKVESGVVPAIER